MSLNFKVRLIFNLGMEKANGFKMTNASFGIQADVKMF